MLDHTTVFMAIFMGLGLAFWLGHYNQKNGDKDCWAWLWLLCLFFAELRVVGLLP